MEPTLFLSNPSFSVIAFINEGIATMFSATKESTIGSLRAFNIVENDFFEVYFTINILIINIMRNTKAKSSPKFSREKNILKSKPVVSLDIKEIIPNGKRYKRSVRKVLKASNRLSHKLIRDAHVFKGIYLNNNPKIIEKISISTVFLLAREPNILLGKKSAIILNMLASFFLTSFSVSSSLMK